MCIFVILFCRFLVTNDVEYLFQMFVIHISSLMKSLFTVFVHLKKKYIYVFLYVYSSSYVLVMSPLLDMFYKCFLTFALL